MDNDIKDLLMQLMEGQTAIKMELSGVKEDTSGLKTEFSGVKEDISGLKIELSGVKEGIAEVKNEVRKNTIGIETINKKIDVIAEVQSAHKEQNDREFANIHNLLDAKTNLIETALTGASKDIREVKESIEVLKEMTGKHEVDINILKLRPV